MIPRSGSRENISDHSPMRSRILAFTCWCVFLSLASLRRASVKLREASSLCILMPQFWLRALASSSVYSCTFALRCASRLIMAATACCAPVSEEPTLSHTSYEAMSVRVQVRWHAPAASGATSIMQRREPYQYVLPVLAREVLVGGLDDSIVKDVGLRAKHGVLPTAPGWISGQTAQCEARCECRWCESRTV